MIWLQQTGVQNQLKYIFHLGPSVHYSDKLFTRQWPLAYIPSSQLSLYKKTTYFCHLYKNSTHSLSTFRCELKYFYRVGHKKHATLHVLLSICSPIIDQFSKFFHWHTLQTICPLSSNRQHHHLDVCLEDNRKDY